MSNWVRLSRIDPNLGSPKLPISKYEFKNKKISNSYSLGEIWNSLILSNLFTLKKSEILISFQIP